MPAPTAQRLTDIFQALLDHFGPQHWWPGDSELEIIVGAVLTQNTNWSNVEKAIANLRSANAIDVHTLADMAPASLAEYIRPAGYFRVKAKRLQNLMRYIVDRFDGDLSRMFELSTWSLREELLAVNGVGRETADSILLYAAGKTIFVVDAYTYRILVRHSLVEPEADYETLQEFFHGYLDDDAAMFNEFHALLVATGKNYCRPRNPKCDHCPLRDFNPHPDAC